MLMVMGGLFVILLSFDMGIKQYIESTYKEKEEHETMIDKVVFRKVYYSLRYLAVYQKRKITEKTRHGLFICRSSQQYL